MKDKLMVVKFVYGDIELDVKVSSEEQTVWLSQNDMALLFKRTKATISWHIKNILQSKTEEEKLSCSKIKLSCSEIKQLHTEIVTIATDGKTYKVDYYSLEIIMEVGKRTRSEMTPFFYDWSQKILSSFSGYMDESNIIRFDNGKVSVDVNFSPEEKTIWLTQKQIAELYETTQQNVSSHIQNIFEDSELKMNSVHKYYLHTALDGKQYSVSVYNLDMILAVGYRTRTSKAIEFRNWATKIITDYLSNGYSIDKDKALLSQDFAKDIISTIIRLENRVTHLEEDRKHYLVENVVIFEGHVFEAKVLMNQIMETATESIVLIDPYVDIRSLDSFKNFVKNVSLLIITSKRKSRLSQLEIESFIEEYGLFTLIYDERYHDRYLIIDNSVFYDLGSSINYMGVNFSSVHRIEDDGFIKIIMDRIKEVR